IPAISVLTVVYSSALLFGLQNYNKFRQIGTIERLLFPNGKRKLVGNSRKRNNPKSADPGLFRMVEKRF
ncbi:MAG: hypothetical protein PUC77_08530, partial [Bacteroidales bacterium]|nr:hypothetical protein [Bacteroidales bacterium]